ncbi:MAG: hypothetical protein ACJ8B6_14935 [Gemmatimonadales bacterium]
MRNHIRLTLASAALLVGAACSRTTEQPALSEDLKQDLARAGGSASDVRLAGGVGGRLDVVSAEERASAAVPSPGGRAISKIASTKRGTRAGVRSKTRQDTPAAGKASPVGEASVRSDVETQERATDPAGTAAQRTPMPRPSTQREPVGGWRTPGEVIRNAPFPINP